MFSRITQKSLFGQISRAAVRRTALASLFLLVLCFTLSAQGLPGKIRGYKVHSEIISLTSKPSPDGQGPKIIVGEPRVTNVSLSGITLTLKGELESAGYSGRVEMMTFRDFRVNGRKVTIADITMPFDLKKNGRTSLPQPAAVFLPTVRLAGAAWEELTGPKDEWKVTGRVFVFGKFKKFGLTFKRAVPVDVAITIKNPLLIS